MPAQRRNLPEQEHSIKARSRELFVEASDADAASKATKPFAFYLRETPARPLSTLAKAVFWIVGTVVVLLFLAAIWRVTHRPVAVRQSPRPPARAPRVPPRGDATGVFASSERTGAMA